MPITDQDLKSFAMDAPQHGIGVEPLRECGGRRPRSPTRQSYITITVEVGRVGNFARYRIRVPGRYYPDSCRIRVFNI